MLLSAKRFSARIPKFMVPTAAALLLVSAGSLSAQQTLSAQQAQSAQQTQSAQQDRAQQDDEAKDLETADPKSTVQEAIVVSANRVETPIDEVGSSVTVIGREEIERRHKTTVLELLRTVPGLDVVQGGGPGRATSVFIRGGNSSHTLVLVDGVRLNSNTSGEFSLSDLSTDNIERIEVLRGPQSGLYGSEAVAGVVSISTLRGAGPSHAWVSGEVGSDNLSRLSAGVRGGDETWDYSLAVANIETDAVSAASEAAGNTEDDPWENLTVSGRFGRSFLEDGRVDLALRYTDGNTAVDGFTFGVGPTDDLNSEQARETLTAGLTITTPIRSWWTQTFFAGVGNDEIVGSDPDNFFSNFEILSETSEFSTQAELALSQSDTLTVGYRVEKRVADNIGAFDESLYLRSVFAQNLWSWQDRHHLTVSVRNDDHSTFGDETTYRLTGSLRLAERTRFHGSFGTGFKAPTFNDLFFPGFGNPDLLPETSEGFDLGLEQTLLDGRLVLDLTYFDSTFEDLILFTFPAGVVNVASATSDGFEFSARWEPTDKLLLQASHTFNETEDGSTGRQLARRPENRSVLYLAFDATARLRGTASLVVVQDRIDSDGSVADDYERLDLSLDYRASSLLRPYLRLENLLDEEYSEVPGFTTPGFTAAVGLHVGL